MMPKIPGSLLFVATVFVLVAGDCIKEIPWVETMEGLVIPSGGYHRIKDPETNGVVKQIVADTISNFNDDSLSLMYFDNDHYVVYRKV